MNLRSYIKPWIAMMLLLLGLAMLTPIATYAAYSEPEGTTGNGPLNTTDGHGGTVSCASVTLADGSTAKGALISSVVPCIIATIQTSAATFTEKMVDLLNPLLWVFLTFVVVMFGVRVASHEPEIYKHGFLLLIKITIVGIILSDLGNYRSYDGSSSTGKLIPTVYQVMDASQSIVADAIDTSSFKCDVSAYTAAGAPKIWATLDCLAGKIFGFKASGGDGKGKMVLMTSLAGLLAGMFVSGPWGVAIMIGMLSVIVSLLSIIIRTASVFINSYLVICLLLIISPLILPLVFLRVTAGYYDALIKNILSSLLTPILFTAFSMFVLLIYDKMLFADDSIVQDLMNYDKIKDALEPPQQPCSWTVTNNPTATRSGVAAPTDADISSLFNTNLLAFMQSLMSPTLTGSNDICAGLPKIAPFNLSAVNNPKYQEGKKTDKELFTELLSLVILSYLIVGAMNQLPDLIARLAAGGTAIYYAINEGPSSLGDRFLGASKAGLLEAIKERPPQSPTAPKDSRRAELGAATRAGLDKFYSTLKGKE